MFSIYDRVPKYLLDKSNLVTTVISAVLFSIVFLLVSVPFSHNAWFELGPGRSFRFTLVFFAIACCVVVVSKRVLYALRTRDMNYLAYILINASEVLLISLLYTFFTAEGVNMGVIHMTDLSFGRIFWSAVVYGAVSLGVPYTVMAQYFAIQDKNNTIRMMNMDSVVTDMSLSPREEKRITLFDNNGMMKFSIRQDNLYFIEADDNYIQVWYTDANGQMKQYMLRCRLKTVEDSFADSDLVRCHRKYIVNINKVRVLRSEDKSYSIDLDIDSVDAIPISKTYEQAVLARFNSR